MLSEQLDFHRIAPAVSTRRLAPPEIRAPRRSVRRSRTTGQLGRCPAGMCCSENSRFTFSSDLLCTGQKRSPGRQLRTVNSRPSNSALSRLSGSRFLRELLWHGDASHRQAELRDANLARNRQDVCVVWRRRSAGEAVIPGTRPARSHPSAGKLRLRRLSEGAAQQLLDVFEVSSDLLALQQSLQQTPLQRKRKTSKTIERKAWLAALL